MTKLKQWTVNNRIAIAAIIMPILIVLAAFTSSHLSAFGGMQSKVQSLGAIVSRHEILIDKIIPDIAGQAALIKGVDDKVQLLLDAWGIKPSPAVTGEVVQ